MRSNEVASLSQFLKAIGPNATIIFAAWIFMGFLQQRYDAAVERYKGAIGDYRNSEHEPNRRDNLRDQILVFKRRCEFMSYACLCGLASAVLLVSTMIVGGLDVIVPDSRFLFVLGAATAFGGFALVIAASVLVIIEATYSRSQLEAELLDVPELAHKTGHEPGTVARQRPKIIRNVSED